MKILLETLSGCIWGNGMMLLLLGTGILCTVRTKCIQLKLPRFLLKRFFRSGDGRKQTQIVCTSLGAAMGTGNITGVSAALAAGGPGAIFWMWVSAFLGMALVYTENTLSAKYSDISLKGTMAYIRKGLGSRLLTSLFCMFCCGSACTMGGFVQVSAVADTIFPEESNIKSLIAALSFAMILPIVLGGASRVGKAAQVLLPLVSAVYGVICIAVIFENRNNIPESFKGIFSSAFGMRQAAGGLLGHSLSRTVSTGLRRGLFSNEAGLGSSPLLHSGTDGVPAEDQGMWAMFEVFVDTIVCCTLTALLLLCSGKEMSVVPAFSAVLGRNAAVVLSCILSVYAFCTVIGWYCCGEKAFLHLTGGRFRRAAPFVFTLIASAGAICPASEAWMLSDICNGLMAIPNLIAVICLTLNSFNRKGDDW